MSILLLGGSGDEQHALTTMLLGAGYDGLVAASSLDAALRLLGFDAAAGSHPLIDPVVDLVLLDSQLPDPDPSADALIVCRRMRSTPGLRDTPVLLVTARAGATRFPEALDAGITDFIAKPVGPGELTARVRIALQLQPALARGRRVDELQQEKDAAVAANRAKSEFLAGMSHGLRTLLNVVIGYSELLQDEAVDQGQIAIIPDLRKIQSAGEHLLSLIDNAITMEIAEAFGQLAAVTSQNAQLLQDIQGRIEDLQRSRQRITAVEERQRREIAELLHGRVQAKLLVAWYQLGECKRLLDTDPVHAAALLDEVMDTLDHVRDQEVRQASHLLHPSIIRIGLAPAVRSLAARFEEFFQVAVQTAPEIAELDDPAHNRIPERLRLMAYRVAEEALNNILRHAEASSVTVSLAVDGEGGIEIAVRDDGCGFDPARVKPGLGLSSIADRVAQAGGTWRLTSAVGQGTEVMVRLPLSGASGDEPTLSAGSPEGTAAPLSPGGGPWHAPDRVRVADTAG
ncbi:MAG: response regulator [Chloroflexi bacterium]|nr:response regulator [Chloroflexota bacterium]